MGCYCRGQGVCDECGGHACTGGCSCDVDGAPMTQAEVTAGHVNPSQSRLEAWATKQELTR